MTKRIALLFTAIIGAVVGLGLSVQAAGVFSRSDHIEYDGVSIKLTSGARLESNAPSIQDHFAYGAGAFNSHVPQNWVTTETGAATPYAPSASTVGGAAIGVTGATTNNAEEFAGKAVIWQPSTQGTLVLEVAAKFVGATTPADGDFGIGLASAVTYTNGLPYVFSAASADTTSVPSEWVGFWYSSIPTSGTLFTASGNVAGCLSTKVDVQTLSSSGVVKDSNSHTYRLEVTATGSATWYIDGKQVCVRAAAITAATALTPYIVAIAKNSHALTATIDYVTVNGKRAW